MQQHACMFAAFTILSQISALMKGMALLDMHIYVSEKARDNGNDIVVEKAEESIGERLRCGRIGSGNHNSATSSIIGRTMTE